MNTEITTTTFSDLVYTENGEVWTKSRIVAERFNRKHFNVMRDIDNLIETLSGVIRDDDSPSPQFERLEIQNEQNGEFYPEYILNRDAFTLLVMGFHNTPKVLEWKLKFIGAFNAMEKMLRSAAPSPDPRQDIANMILKTSTRSQVQAIKELYPDYFSPSALPGSLEYTSDVNTAYQNWIDDFGITIEWITDFPTKDIYTGYVRYCTENRLPYMGKKIFYRTVENDFNLSRRQKSDGLRYFMTF